MCTCEMCKCGCAIHAICAKSTAHFMDLERFLEKLFFAHPMCGRTDTHPIPIDIWEISGRSSHFSETIFG